jgi:hypothetical protein
MNLSNLEILKREFSGELILPGSDQYEQTRSSFMCKGSPAMVMQPKNIQDIKTALKFGQDNTDIISIRSGGHSGAGFSTNTDGVVIDLSAINNIEVNVDGNRIVKIGTGAVWKNVGLALQKHGLAISSGDTTSVGVGGLTLGGGIGWMVRKHGLTIDSLLSAEVVTADGQVLQASETENSDLFWGIRGGGGNFGIVTNFTFSAHPLKTVFAGFIQYALDNLSGTLKMWRDYMRTADEALTTTFIVMPSMMGNPPAAFILCCYAGSNVTEAMKAINPLLNFGNVVMRDVKEKTYPEVLEEPRLPPGAKIIVKSGFVENFNDELINLISETSGKPDSPVYQIRGIGGAMKNVDPESTAFFHRSSEVMIIVVNFLPPDASESVISNATIPWKKIRPLTTGAYANFLSNVSDEEIQAIYPERIYKRLADIKSKYDPMNVFNRNYNIKPAKVLSI